MLPGGRAILFVAAVLSLFSLDLAFGQVPATGDDSVSMLMTCHVSGIRPIPPTDLVTFKGSDAWARVGTHTKTDRHVAHD